MSIRWTAAVAALLVWGALAATARPDVVVLKNGGRLTGEILNDKETAREAITLETAGGKVMLAKAQIAEILTQRPAETEYQRIRFRYADTVEGQWALAEWCREHELTRERQQHLRRIVELEPDHEKARRGLGHSRINGQWTTQEEFMRKQGMEYYKGQWVTPQEKQIMEEKRKLTQAEKDWKQRLNRWRLALAGPKAPAARESILAMQDPSAVTPLGEALNDDPRPEARRIYAEALAGIGNQQAKGFLAVAAVKDPHPEVRTTCLDWLKKAKSPETVAYFVAKLGSPDNVLVNRAGEALKEMGDKSAIGPLIDHLVTVHKVKIVTGNPGQMSMSFGSNGGGGMSMNQGPRIEKYTKQNRDVLDALEALTGVNFSFNVPQWQAWYTAQKNRAAPTLDARRD